MTRPMTTIDTYKKIDATICTEAKVTALAKVLGYDEIGEPIEIVYDLAENGYAFHVGGCRRCDVSDELAVILFEQKVQQ